MADVVFGNHDNSTLFGAKVHYVCREDTIQLDNGKRLSSDVTEDIRDTETTSHYTVSLRH